MEKLTQILEHKPFKQALGVGRFIMNQLQVGGWGDTAEDIRRPEASITYYPPLEK